MGRLSLMDRKALRYLKYCAKKLVICLFKFSFREKNFKDHIQLFIFIKFKFNEILNDNSCNNQIYYAQK